MCKRKGLNQEQQAFEVKLERERARTKEKAYVRACKSSEEREMLR